MTNVARWFVAVVVLQAVALVGWAGWHEWNRGHAPTIWLESAPVDPRDLLRGDYMTLSYKIGRVRAPGGVTRDPRSAVSDYGREVWVTLRKAGRFHEAVAAQWTEPVADEGNATDIVVHGRTMGVAGDGELRVVYGIEKFFVPEGKGTPDFRELVVEATVSAGGRLGIKRVLLDGKAWP